MTKPSDIRDVYMYKYEKVSNIYFAYCKLTNTTPLYPDNSYNSLPEYVRFYENLCEKHNLT